MDPPAGFARRGPKNAHGLVGDTPIIYAEMDGVQVPCLLDTGSQVTMLKQSFFLHHFGQRGVKLKDASSWLSIRAANGLSVPYIGYAQLEVRVGSIQLPACGVVIVTDECLSGPPGLLGMNVIQDCWDHLFKEPRPDGRPEPPQATMAGQEAWCRALKLVEEGERFASPEGRVGYVRLMTRRPVKIPPNSEILLYGRTRPGPKREDYECIIEPLCSHPGVSCARTLFTVRRGRVVVKLRNISLSPAYVYRNQRVGEVWYVKPSDAILQPEVNLVWVGQQTVEVSRVLNQLRIC